MTLFEERYKRYRLILDEKLRNVIDRDKPESMYIPARYVLESGGKRIRPILVLLACEAVGGNPEDAFDASVAVEILHNFTLVHDDIMDNASRRRGRLTVHTKWDTNTAILVGDQLIGIAYNSLLKTRCGDLRELISVFNDGMIEVCEGQSYDKEFELRSSVTEAEYLMMIGKKTGRLVSMSAEMGAMIGRASTEQRTALTSYAEHIGQAFQILDDTLDVVADEKDFGKVIGGDILEGKKTYLLVKALEVAQGSDQEALLKVAEKRIAGKEHVEIITSLYERLGILEIAREHIRRNTDDALDALKVLPHTEAREMLVWFAEMLLRREN